VTDRAIPAGRHVPPGRGRLGCLLLACLLVAGCGSGQQAAFDRAAEDVRARANALPDKVSALLAAPSAPAGGQPLRDHIAYALPGTGNFVPFVAEADGPRIRLRVAITATRADGGGLGGVTHESARLCVELTGTRGADPRVELRDTPCDETAITREEPDAQRGISTVSLSG